MTPGLPEAALLALAFTVTWAVVRSLGPATPADPCDYTCRNEWRPSRCAEECRAARAEGRAEP